MKRILLILSTVMFVAGCVSPVVKVPSDEQVGSADYGEKPDMAQVEKNIKAWAIETLKDPSAMQLLDISSSSKEGWLSVCLRPVENECYERNFYFGHIVTAKINAKNSHGGYSGYKTYSFLFHGNKIVFYLSPDIIK